MNRSVGRGAFVLIISGIICKLFGAFFRLPLTNILGMEGIALFQMVMSLYSLAVVFISNGLTNALSKLISSARAKGERVKAGAYLKLALKYVLIVSFSLGSILAIFSKQIASIQGWKGGGSYILMLFLLPLGGLIGVYRGVIQGHENMTPTALSQIIEQVSRFAFGLVFAYLFGKQSVNAGVFGAFLGIVISEALAFVYLQFALSRNVKGYKDSGQGSLSERKEFYHAVLPLSFSNAVIPLSHAIESLVILPLLSLAGIGSEIAKKLYGLQTGMVGTILSFPLLVSLAVGMALLPKVSYLSTSGEVEAERTTVNRAFCVMWAFLVPLVLGMTAISKEFYLLVYPSVIKDYILIAQDLTYITAISTLMAGVMQFLFAILQGKGLYRQALYFSLIGGGVKILSLVIFARMGRIGIYAIPISNALLNSTIALCSIIKLYKLVKIDVFSLLLPPLSGVVMLMSVRLLLSAVQGLAGLILSVIAGGIVYVVLTLPLWNEILKPFIDKIKKGQKRLEN